MAVAGLLIVFVHLYDYLMNKLNPEWYLSFFIGSYALIYGVGEMSGWIKPKASEIVIDYDGIRTNTTAFTDTFRWTKFKHVKLNKSDITVQYAESGLKNSLKIPLLIRVSSGKMQELKTAISMQCDLHSIPFESEI
jgi:hypothetical protein